MIWVIGAIVYLFILLFILAMCKVAGDADRRGEIEYLRRRKEGN
jgi:hypothetical protein